MTGDARYAPAAAVLGAEHERVRGARILIVGAGGIGCEVLKDLVLAGVGHIEIVRVTRRPLTQIDLDTIDLSNLNRQFLFQKQHIKQPKAVVAKASASAFNPDVTVVAHHADVKAPEFDLAFYNSFDVVLSALDNLETRRWVNRMCVMADVPSVESGTAGFLGQVQPIRPRHTECYDCTAHPMPTTYPVCTIRSTPSTPVHCIVWAKSWLFPCVPATDPPNDSQLFGKADDDDAELTAAEQAGESARELANLRAEARQMREMRDELLAAREDATLERIFDKVYDTDIQRLLSMEDMWAHRTRPTPLSLHTALASDVPEAPQVGLRDRRVLSLRENAALFMECGRSLAARASQAPQSFDKDDDDSLGFVTAAANLRAHVYHIPEKTRFETKQIAGNIIPAIATTNAVISGMVVVQALHVLAERWDALRVVSLARRATRVFTTFPPDRPNASCGVCQDVYVRVGVDVARTTLQQVLDTARSSLGYTDDAELSLAHGTRILFDLDLDDNLGKTLAQLNVAPGDLLSVVDEDHVKATAQLVLERGAGVEVRTKVELPNRPAVATSTAAAADDDADDIEVVDPAALPAKRTKRTHDESEEHSAKRARAAPAPEQGGASASAAIVLE